MAASLKSFKPKDGEPAVTGVAPQVIVDLLGRTRIGTTMDIYAP